MRAVFSDGNHMVSELHWHPKQKNSFLWQILSISLTRSLSLTLRRTNTALAHTPCPLLLSHISKLKHPPLPQTQTHCAKGGVFQKGKTKTKALAEGKQADYRAMSLYQKTTII